MIGNRVTSTYTKRRGGDGRIWLPSAPHQYYRHVSKTHYSEEHQTCQPYWSYRWATKTYTTANRPQEYDCKKYILLQCRNRSRTWPLKRSCSPKRTNGRPEQNHRIMIWDIVHTRTAFSKTRAVQERERNAMNYRWKSTICRCVI